MFQEDAMRIIAGEWRGRRLNPPINASVRPTPDRVRESIFSILHSRFDGDWHSKRVADFCAGTGALGLEALSRGAAHCVFVEKDSAAAKLVEQNIALVKAGVRAAVQRGDVTHLPLATTPVDLIFFDPPYNATFIAEALACAINQNWTTADTMCVIEQPTGTMLEMPGWQCDDIRRYGKTQLMLFGRIN
jgi:16S rRNA (guanine966-N2)-methyltransferase